MRAVTYQNYGTPVNYGVGYNIPPNVAVSGSPAVQADITGTSTFMFPWICTARQSLTQQRYNLADRTASDCYMVGLKEVIRLQTSGPDEWDWRRIAFTFKGPLINSVQANFYQDSTQTYRYLYTPSNETTTTNRVLIQQSYYGLLFDGQLGQDWTDPFTAKTDNSRVTVKYDKRMRIRSGNNAGVTRYVNCWHPMNKTLAYDDDEAGSGTQNGVLSVNSKKGMGDYYIIDLFRCTNTTGNTVLYFHPQPTLYWHEK